MAQVEININGESYRIACEDGQEDRLIELSGLVNLRIQDLVKQVGHVGHTRLLVMASLVLADELIEIREIAQTDSGESDGDIGNQTILAIERATNRLETIAERINQA